MKKKRTSQYFIVVHPEDRKSQSWIINMLSAISHKYPHLDGKADVVESLSVERDTYLIVRSI